MHHQAAALLQLEQIGEAVLVDLQADPDRTERAPHQLVELAVALVRDRGIADDERLAVGQRAIALRSPAIAELVEQGIGGPGVVTEARIFVWVLAGGAAGGLEIDADR